MQPFTLPISTSPALTITGLVSIPTSASASPSTIPGKISAPSAHRPLLVLLHGGSYDARYYDASPEHSIEPLATILGIPVISLNRQGYKDSTPVSLPADGSTTSFKQQAHNLHTHILPALWEKYGRASGATSLVLGGHSVGGMIAVVTASLHATTSKPSSTSPSSTPSPTPTLPATASTAPAPSYPLSGLLTTGISLHWHPSMLTSTPPLLQTDPSGTFILWPNALRDALLLQPSSGRAPATPSFTALHATLNNPAPIAEVQESMLPPETSTWVAAAAHVSVPVLGLVGEFDALWDTGREGMRAFEGVWAGAKSVEVGVLGQAPHCAELGFGGRSVWLRVLGFAVGCAVAQG
ncbi:hypothetical protein K491DRAFT_558366, partial [Lophiostoma macrostomum CBS 122681]